ncbi:AI-2E family transporter [Gordonia sp. (in: high G+C Gram-positive bacteria)]|uniref:AI-2E family transporter n=1 Tax=Gordonia sp. (in: high G+C Gram-positive bacteria) TaxID=84139 RepID=UPI001692CD26|nr:AI-2E family transporter [Gordonia sp. (in: high G+C Gram-positive bacteria)]NLG45483.1 AI-2E family transporter [Gordonia sp. (in: high G+C Gram-positive bacteria)]
MSSESGGRPGSPDSGWVDDQVHPGVRVAAAWTWRLLIIGAGLLVLGKIFLRFQEVFVPVAIAILLAALLEPLVRWLARHHVPRSVGVLTAVVLTLAVIAAGLSFVVQQLISGIPRMSGDVANSIAKLRTWLEDGPFNLDSASLRQGTNQVISWLQSHEATIATGAIDTATVVTKLATAALLTVFLLIFFLYDGRRIWSFVTRLVPIAHREHLRGAGDAGFHTLQSYVRATVLVALLDAVGIGIGLAILRVPMVLPLTALIFLGAFIPIVGSVAAGSIAVLIALATQGWVTALLVVVVLIVVMQVEGHVLQPFLMGRSVKLHPVAVIIVIAAGIMVAGIVGGLLAVPTLAFVNTAVSYRRPPGDPIGSGELVDEPVALDPDPPRAE